MAIYVIQPAGSGSSSSTAQAGHQAIGSGVSTIAVTFGSAFASAPSVVVSVANAAGDPLIYANVAKASITTTGFTANLSATTGTANYVLEWSAA